MDRMSGKLRIIGFVLIINILLSVSFALATVWLSLSDSKANVGDNVTATCKVESSSTCWAGYFEYYAEGELFDNITKDTTGGMCFGIVTNITTLTNYTIPSSKEGQDINISCKVYKTYLGFSYEGTDSEIVSVPYDYSNLDITLDPSNIETSYTNITIILGEITECNPAPNQDWIIEDNQSCVNKNIDLGTGKIIINPNGNLYLLNYTNITANGLEINKSGDAVYINEGCELRLN